MAVPPIRAKNKARLVPWYTMIYQYQADWLRARAHGDDLRMSEMLRAALDRYKEENS